MMGTGQGKGVKKAQNATEAEDRPLKVRMDEGGCMSLSSLDAFKGKEGAEAWRKAAMGTFGSIDHDFVDRLARQVITAAPSHLLEDPAKWANAVLAAMHGIKPRDPLEGMLVGQMLAVHAAGMECARRAFLEEQTFEGTDANINRMTKMMRTFAAQVEALQKYRNGGKQTVTVQHVNVEDGGQALIGNLHKQKG